MREAVAQMLAKYDCQRLEDTTRALREILQELALLGLWRVLARIETPPFCDMLWRSRFSSLPVC